MSAIWEFLTFRKMIGPLLLQLLFWALLVLNLLFGLWLLRQGDLNGWVVLIIGTLGLRVLFEVLLLFFRIHGRLTEIAKTLTAVDEATKVMADDDEEMPPMPLPKRKATKAPK